MNELDFHRYAILPAAGRSVRMGKPKLLLPWEDCTVIEAVLRVWHASQVEQVWVVVHPEDQPLADVCRSAGAKVVVASTPPPDMRASLCLGLTALLDSVGLDTKNVVLTAPADIPGLSPAVIDLLLKEHDPAIPKILVPMHDGHKGHPVLLPSGFAQQLFSLPADQGLNALLTPDRIKAIPCTRAGVPEDLDTPEDYQRLKPD